MDAQEAVDAFYFKKGKCCAGCDHWRHINSVAGECLMSQIVSGSERAGMFNMRAFSCDIAAGHVLTPRHHVCAKFQDTFDWRTLPPHYLRKVGASLPPPPEKD